jgi:hypothetical protein
VPTEVLLDVKETHRNLKEVINNQRKLLRTLSVLEREGRSASSHHSTISEVEESRRFEKTLKHDNHIYCVVF